MRTNLNSGSFECQLRILGSDLPKANSVYAAIGDGREGDSACEAGSEREGPRGCRDPVLGSRYDLARVCKQVDEWLTTRGAVNQAQKRRSISKMTSCRRNSS